MKIIEEINNKTCLLKLQGRLDAVSSKALKESVNSVIKKDIK